MEGHRDVSMDIKAGISTTIMVITPSLKGLGACGGHSIQKVNRGWPILSKEKRSFGTSGSERQGGRKGSRGNGECSGIMPGLNTGNL